MIYSEVGNLMPLAMANLLQSHIVIFNIDSHTPLYVTPTVNQQDRAMFLVHDPKGPGHYDAAITYSVSQNMQQPPVAMVKCNCGVNTSDISVKSCCFRPRYTCICQSWNSIHFSLSLQKL